MNLANTKKIRKTMTKTIENSEIKSIVPARSIPKLNRQYQVSYQDGPQYEQYQYCYSLAFSHMVLFCYPH